MVSLVRRFTRVLRKDTLCMLHGLCSLVAVERTLRENHGVKAPQKQHRPSKTRPYQPTESVSATWGRAPPSLAHPVRPLGSPA